MVEVVHLKNIWTLNCVQLVSSRKISISANSKVPYLYRLYPSCTYVCTDCTSIVYIYIYICICTDSVLVLYIFIHRLYLSVLQLYHRLLTVEQTHKINKLVTLSLSLSLSLSYTHINLTKSFPTCMFYASAVNKIGRFILVNFVYLTCTYLSLYSNCT